MHVLVAFASQQGSTGGIAEAIGDQLRAAGHAVDVRPVAEAADPAGYDAIVLGSAVHDGSWLTPASDFARRNLDALAGRPVWLFSVGSIGSDRGWPLGALAERQPKDIGRLRSATRARGFRAFAGVVPSDWPTIWRLVFNALGVHAGDARNWADVGAWARGIAGELGPIARHGRDPAEQPVDG
jgi:menaquinone-dependent protoporphyrinogen oxidase